ncbi:MAG: T9SS type A sorting domain-containing protein [Bacteroidetes bacterium]|nr:T9SS type A sorting domain-containing protein [Bacteroidota bacterium]
MHFEAESISMVRLLNSAGQLISEVSKSGQHSGTLELMVDQLPAGLYFLEAITASGTYKQKFQKL